MFKRIYYNQKSNKIQLWEINNGKTVKIEEKPELVFYIPDKTKKSEITDIYESPVVPKIAEDIDRMKAFRETGIKTCETDIPIEVKYLQQRYLGKTLTPNMKDINICFLDIEVESPNEFPKPEEAKWPVNLITMKFSQSGRLVTLGLREFDETKVSGESFVKEYHWIPDEKKLIEKAIEISRKEKVDIFTGWYSDEFDFLYLQNRKENLGIKKCFSPVNDDKITYKGDVRFGGVAILDLRALYKKFTYSPRDSYSLQAIGTLEIGEGKLDYEGTINTAWRDDWHNFVNYNVQDVLLVEKLENKLRFIELVVNIAYQALVPFQAVFSQMSVLTGYILKFLHEQGMVLPDREKSHKEKLPGAFVMAIPGMYQKVVSLDVASMYPHMIMQYNIGPDTLVLNPSEEEKKNLYSCPVSEYKTWNLTGGEKLKVGGIYYRKDKVSVLSKIVSKIFNERKDMKKLMYEARDNGDKDLQSYYDRQQQIRKILINSMYGVLGNKHFHLYNNYCAMTITLSSQHLIKYLSETTNDYFKNYFWQNKTYFPIRDEKNKLKNNPCILIDTDSVAGDSILITNEGDKTIEDLFNKYKDVYGSNEEENEIVSLHNQCNLKVLSGKTKKTSYNLPTKLEENFGKVNYISKHKVKKRMYKIKFKDKEVVCTEDHSIIIKRNGFYIDVSPKDILPGDEIVVKKMFKFFGGLKMFTTKEFEIEDLGIKEMDVYDIEVEDNHNFFANDILVHNSNYFCFDETFQKLGLNFVTDDEFVEWINHFNDDFLKPFFQDILNLYAEKFGVPQLIVFEKEKVITDMIILAKKKYVTRVKDNEGKIYDKPKMKVTGIEIIKTSTPAYNRKILPNIVDLIFDTKDKEEVITKLKEVKKEFKKQDISEISSPRGISEYTKYADPIKTYLKDGLKYKKGVPIHARAAINYNYTIAKKGIDGLVPVNNGTKLKFVFIKENNYLKQNVIAFINQYPKEFEDIFEIDYELQFEKSFLTIIQRFFDVLGWNQINLKKSKMKKLLSY